MRRAVPGPVESCLMFGAPRASGEIALARSSSRHDLVVVVGLGGRQGAGASNLTLAPSNLGASLMRPSERGPAAHVELLFPKLASLTFVS
jgi:hypothetical protein